MTKLYAKYDLVTVEAARTAEAALRAALPDTVEVNRNYFGEKVGCCVLLDYDDSLTDTVRAALAAQHIDPDTALYKGKYDSGKIFERAAC